jgi:DNA-binding response OmpR family regulator
LNASSKKRAILFLNQNDSIEPLIEALASNGFELFAADDLEAGLSEHRREPFSLAVVEDGYKSLSAPAIVQELLKISWTTHSIIVTDKDEDQLHEQAEGLGILGGMKDRHDVKRLNELLTTLRKILGEA